MPTIARHAAAILAVAATIAAGCGDSGSTAGGSTATETVASDREDGYETDATTTMEVAEPPLTKARFVRQINEVCRETWPKVLDNWARYTDGQNLQLSRNERFAEAVRASLLNGIDFYIFDSIFRLGSPPGDAKELEAIIGPFQVAVELGWKDRWRAYSAADVEAQFAPFNERAHRYGLVDCLVTRARLQPTENL